MVVYVNTSFFFTVVYPWRYKTERRRKVNLSAYWILIETLMNRSALFGGWLYRNDAGIYPGEVDARI